MDIYDPKKLAEKWNKQWQEARVYQPELSSYRVTKLSSDEKTESGKSQADYTTATDTYYNLMMFPYPSAEGLHVGNMYAFTGSDVWGRYMRMNCKAVFEPIGLDGFGIHSENYAIKIGRHPKEHAKVTQENFYRQLASIGNGFAWENRLETYDPEYYRWTQWIFIKLFNAGLAYRKKATVNWCPSCKTVLADEQVLQKSQIPNSKSETNSKSQIQNDKQDTIGVCERCESEVETRDLEQWFFRITKYADRLLDNLDKIDWDNKVKVAQRNWIGRKEGHVVRWQVAGGEEHIETFTTRIDTLLGVTFLAVSLNSGEEVREAGYKVVHPVTGEEIPVWVADYVVTDYGTGAVMGVPVADERDRAFAKKYGLEVREFRPFKPQGEDWVKAEKRYHLRDWLISRQRYWGPPIPMIYCSACAQAGRSWQNPKSEILNSKQIQNSKFKIQNNRDNAGWYPVPEEDLPVLLPDLEDFKPGDGKSPLERAGESFWKVACPECGGEAKRETDVSDTFLDSAWYFLRYPSVGVKNSKLKIQSLPWDPEITLRWLPVDMYIGGAEHSVLHLLYARFVTMFFYDLKLLQFEEPFIKFRAHGLIIKDGAKMSKSKGNVVNPDEYIAKYGADTLRTYLMFVGPLRDGGDFRDSGMVGMYRFLERVWNTFSEESSTNQSSMLKYIGGETTPTLKRKLHWAIKRATEGIERLKYNTAIAAVMELLNDWRSTENNEQETMSNEDAGLVLRLLAPFAPYLTEELWSRITLTSPRGLRPCSRGARIRDKERWEKGQSIHVQEWPTWEESLLASDTTSIVIQVNGRVRSTIQVQSEKLKVQNAEEEMAKLAKEDDKIKPWVEGKEIKQVVWVPGKLVNLVTD